MILPSRLILWGAMAVADLIATGQGAVETSGPVPIASEGGSKGGALEGWVHYQPDQARPWRLGRYYLKDGKQGALAETVVALTGLPRSLPRTRHEPRTVTIDQENFQFIPEIVAIQAGDWVRLTNSDGVLHNVMTVQGKQPFNVNLGQGESYVHRFSRATGIGHPVRLSCLYHGSMRAWVFVFDHPFFTVTSADGRFVFKQIPPGDYRLQAVHPAGRLEWSQTVAIQAGKRQRIEIQLSPDHLRLSRRRPR